MNSIGLNIEKILDFVPKKELEQRKEEVMAVMDTIHEGTGKGNDFLGWLHLPSSIDSKQLDAIEASAKVLREHCDVVVCIGIGGSYLGTKAVVEALNSSFDMLTPLENRKNPVLLYAGNNIGEDYLFELLEYLQDKSFGLINISKSGTTTEPAIAFRLLKKLLEDKVGQQEAAKRIVAITDQTKGALRTLADKEGYQTFVIPDNVGGRFSVLTPVGLLPIAVAGFDIRQLVAGAAAQEKATDRTVSFEDNLAAQYAVARNTLYNKGKKIEILVNFHPKMHYIGEWWKQLFGESEGKEHKALFNAAVDFTTDLHSMGQWIQEGERSIFETVISIEEPDHKVIIPSDTKNLDGLNYLAGKRVDYVNKMAELGTQVAHVDGGVPNIRITMPKLNEYYIGELFYFFEKACAISGYLLDVNPFNQPGVEAYKKNMFALLEKPGFEEASKAIREKL